MKNLGYITFAVAAILLSPIIGPIIFTLAVIVCTKDRIVKGK